MDNQNYLFYEAFTKLDQVCMTIYQMENGVCEYIAEMAEISSAYWGVIPGWKEDLDQLYRYRLTYNSLAQSADAFREALCSPEDVQWLQLFRSRILDREDPLALLQERGYRAEDDAVQRLEDNRVGELVIKTVSSRDRYVNGPLVVWVILVAVVLVCLICTVILSQR